MTSINHSNNLCLVTLPSPSTSADPDKLHSKLEALEKVEKLCENYTNLNTKQNEPKKLLDNLCDGLETFLGFNSASKGYTGQGIVYSDLDRLCDGVMGFLSGVLNEVKNDPSVTTYYKGMEKTLQTIKTNMHKSGGLSAAVEAVSEALGEWDRELNKKTNALTNRLNELKNNNINRMHESLNALNELDDNSLDNVTGRLMRCIGDAGELNNAFDNAKKAYKALDPALRNKLRGAFSSAEVHVKTFVAAANNSELKALLQFSEDKLNELYRDAQATAESLVKQMRDNINTHFESQIRKPIGVVKFQLGVISRDLQAWITKAHDILTMALNKCEYILEKVKDSHENNVSHGRKTKITKEAELLRDKAITLLAAAKDAKEKVQSTVKTALGQVKEMDGMLKWDLQQVKQEIDTAIKQYVMKDLLGSIKGQILLITNREGLEGLRERLVKDYAATFEKKFADRVKEWIGDILESDEIVRKHIAQYVTDNPGIGIFNDHIDRGNKALNPSNISNIADAIKEQMKKLGIKMANAQIESDDDRNKAQANIEAVYDCVITFVAELQQRIKEININRNTTDFITGIAKAIEGSVKAPTKTGDTFINSLQSAVRYLIISLYTKANQVVSDLDDLTGENGSAEYVGKVDDALRVATTLFANIETASSSGKGVSPYDLHNQIDSVLDDRIGKMDSRAAKILINTLHFNKYKDFIAQTPDSLAATSANPEPLQGRLAESVKAIRKQVADVSLNLISPGENSIDENTFNTPFREIEKELNELTELIEKSDSFSKEVALDDKGVRTLLRELKQGINSKVKNIFTHGLKEIQQRINDIIGKDYKDDPNTLATIFMRAERFYNDIVKAQADDAIGSIKEFLTGEFTRATKEIQKKAKNDYYTKIHATFTDMKSTVTNEVNIIKHTIETDLDSGVKGLLRIMMDKENTGEKVKHNKLQSVKDAVISHTVVQSRNVIPPDDAKNFRCLSNSYRQYMEHMLLHIEHQVRTPEMNMVPYPNGKSEKVNELRQKLNQLLSHLGRPMSETNYTFDHTFVQLRDSLDGSLNEFTPSTFDGFHNSSLLDILLPSLARLVEELRKTYINTYSGANPISHWTDVKKNGTTENFKKCAKIFCTIAPIILSSLRELKTGLEKNDHPWTSHKIYNATQSNSSLHYLFFKQHGYDSDVRVGAEHGELNHRENFNGSHILAHLIDVTHKLFITRKEALTPLPLASSTDVISVEHVEENGLLQNIYSSVQLYYDVCHVAAASPTKQPCSVFDMLVWLSGLPHNTIFSALTDHIQSLFLVENEKQPSRKTVEPIKASPSNITAYGAATAVKELCEISYPILTTTLGTGDALTMYACDFPNNALRLYYPTSGEDCFNMLLDIMRRVFPILRFLHIQCCLDTEYAGWSQCTYGRDVRMTKSQCREHSNSKSNCQPTCQANCQPKCQVKCQPASPLMSYLNDCLPGHLPHHLVSVGCKSVCKTCATSKRGLPCLTPLGFRGFSGSTKTGSYLGYLLGDLFEIECISALFALDPKPPSTLPEHFSYALGIAQSINSKAGIISGIETFETSIVSSITDQSINLYPETYKLTSALVDAYGSEYTTHSKCDNPHLMHLTSSLSCGKRNFYSGRYLYTLSADSYDYVANKHADMYLSCAVYLPWTLQSYLKLLLDEFQQIVCQDWGCRKCQNGSGCKRGQHGSFDLPCHCKSIVECHGVIPTLYKCGFTFGNATELKGIKQSKTCTNFCSQLRRIINSKYFETLFERCDEFIFTIRQPFIWLNVALWSLSLFYLICVMVGRLDLLHIRSHLRSPSSHKITAQSLLAAAQVGRLAKVSYLQP